jgi:hypothetical protein
VPQQAVWKKLAAELEEHGIESPHLARVMARVKPEQQLANVEREIVQEIAGALGRTEERIDLALAELDLRLARFRRARERGVATPELGALVDAYNLQRKVAQARLRDLLIHREAAGFRRNEILSELYPIPPALTADSQI